MSNSRGPLYRTYLAQELNRALQQAKKEQAEKEQAEKEQAEKEQAEKEQAEKEQAEKEQAKKEQAEKEQAEKEQAEKEQAEKEQAEKEQAETRKTIEQLTELLSQDQKMVYTVDAFRALLQKAQNRLPKYTSLIDFSGLSGEKQLNEIHQDLSYLLLLHPTWMEKHPIFLGENKAVLNMIASKIGEIPLYNPRIQGMISYTYRVTGASHLKMNPNLLDITCKIYNAIDFLRNSLHEVILVDMIQPFFPNCRIWLSSNIDDRMAGFDLIVMNKTTKKLCFGDFCFIHKSSQTEEETLRGKEQKIATLMTDDTLNSTEFAVYLYEQFGLSLADMDKMGVVFQVNKKGFDAGLAGYLSYIAGETDTYPSPYDFITCSCASKVTNFLK